MNKRVEIKLAREKKSERQMETWKGETQKFRSSDV